MLRSMATSPSDVASLTLRGLGWDVKDQHRVVGDLGVEFNLAQIPPIQVRALAPLQGAARASDRRPLFLQSGQDGPPAC
eukprot:5310573-Pyramimonas_sp.AAC.1